MLLVFIRLACAKSGEETPVPIPNTEVKLSSADGTYWATGWESRPVQALIDPVDFCGVFYYMASADPPMLVFLCSVGGKPSSADGTDRATSAYTRLYTILGGSAMGCREVERRRRLGE